jgi:chromosome segregation ATPase
MLSQIRSLLSELEIQHDSVSRHRDKLVIENNSLQRENGRLAQQNAEYVKKIAELQSRVEDLEDDRRQLTKVSSIINMEKQNQALKAELDALNDKLNKLVTATAPAPEAAAEAAPQEERQPTVVERTIKGIVYYIRDDEVYTKNEDGTMGDLVGKLVKIENNKTKVVWA